MIVSICGSTLYGLSAGCYRLRPAAAAGEDGKQPSSARQVVAWGAGSEPVRQSGATVLLTASHLLGASFLALEFAPVWLCDGTTGTRLARILAAGIARPLPNRTSLDAAIAVVPPGSMLPAAPPVEPARPGDRVWLMKPGNPAPGRIVDVAWPSGHYGAENDLVIESESGSRFASSGDSGALVINSHGAALGLYVGEAAHRGSTPRWCAHPMTQVAELFGLEV